MATKRNKNFTNEKSKTERRTSSRRPKSTNDSRFRKGKDEQVMEKKPGGNDPRWWGSPDYVKAVSSFNFASPLGKEVPYEFYNDPLSACTYKMATTNVLKTIPGIMAIDILPTMGIADTSSDAINQYFRSFFSKLRSTNNQNAPYQAPDLGMYIMAIDSVHMGIEQLIRMYGIARTYSPMNRYYPEAALKAMGVNPDAANANIYSNLADFRATILNMLIRIQTLAIPKGINANERHREMVKYLYKDGESVKAQMYLFRTPYLYKYNELYSSSGGGLEATAAPINGSIWDWCAYVNDLITTLTNSQFFSIVSGDIIKSFGYEELYGMPFFDETYTVVPVYNPEILLEIHNIKVCGDRYEATAFDVTQDAGTNSLMAHPYFTTGNIPGAGPVYPIVDVPVDTPDADLVMVATRLSVTGTVGYTDSKFKFNPSAIGTEVVIRLSIFYVNASGAVASVSTDTNCLDGMSQINNFIMYELFFDWHPHIYYLTVTTDRSQAQLHTIMSELANYTVMAPGDLQKMHEMAVYGALTCVNLDNVGLK